MKPRIYKIDLSHLSHASRKSFSARRLWVTKIEGEFYYKETWEECFQLVMEYYTDKEERGN